MVSVRTWRTVAVLLAAAYAGHALLFDWSDIGIHVVVALVALVTTMRWPRLTVAAFGLLATLVIVGHLATRASTAELTLEVRPGMPWADARRALGPPTYEVATFEEASQLEIGYSVPSPFRFRRRGPVAVFLRGEYALWVFHDGSTVLGTFVGGS